MAATRFTKFQTQLQGLKIKAAVHRCLFSLSAGSCVWVATYGAAAYHTDASCLWKKLRELHAQLNH